MGMAKVLSDQIIEYTPGAGFVDRDQFIYWNCDVVDATGKAECDSHRDRDRAGPGARRRRRHHRAGDAARSWSPERHQPGPGQAASADPAGPRQSRGAGPTARRPHHLHAREGFADKDSFTYDYREGVVGRSVAAPAACPFATVTVTVNEGLVPVDDPDVVTVEGRQVDIDPMKNDHHLDADRLQVKPRPGRRARSRCCRTAPSASRRPATPARTASSTTTAGPSST